MQFSNKINFELLLYSHSEILFFLPEASEGFKTIVKIMKALVPSLGNVHLFLMSMQRHETCTQSLPCIGMTLFS